MIPLIISAMLAIPLVDGHRVMYGEYDAPAVIGWSQAHEDIVNLQVFNNNKEIFLDTVEGSVYNLFTAEQGRLDFYVDGVYDGTLVPEPSTLMLMLLGLLRRKK